MNTYLVKTYFPAYHTTLHGDIYIIVAKNLTSVKKLWTAYRSKVLGETTDSEIINSIEKINIETIFKIGKR